MPSPSGWSIGKPVGWCLMGDRRRRAQPAVGGATAGTVVMGRIRKHFEQVWRDNQKEVFLHGLCSRCSGSSLVK